MFQRIAQTETDSHIYRIVITMSYALEWVVYEFARLVHFVLLPLQHDQNQYLRRTGSRKSVYQIPKTKHPYLRYGKVTKYSINFAYIIWQHLPYP